MLLYAAAIHLYRFMIWLASFWNSKADKMIKGRANIFQSLESFRKKNKNQKLIWFHAASLGEFEQGRPMMEAIKSKYPEFKIMLTFFSPSGYEIRKNYPGADFVCYLPFDIEKNASNFIAAAKPDLTIFIKYEFWLNYLNILHKKRIPTYLVAAIIHKEQPFFKWYGGVFRKTLHFYKNIFVQDTDSAKSLIELGVENVITTGDTRFDRVIQIAEEPFHDEKLSTFCKGRKVIIAGSSYFEEENLLAGFINERKKSDKNVSLILAPHEINPASMQRIEKILKEHQISYCRYTHDKISTSTVMILDTMGMLSSVYRFGKIAIVGGGFSNGIHSILEAAVYGMPVLFGPHHQKFKEANEMIECGAAFTFENYNQLKSKLEQLLKDENYFSQVSLAARKYVVNHSGATDKTLAAIDFNESKRR